MMIQQWLCAPPVHVGRGDVGAGEDEGGSGIYSTAVRRQYERRAPAAARAALRRRLAIVLGARLYPLLAVAAISAPAAMSCSTTRACPLIAAPMSAVVLPRSRLVHPTGAAAAVGARPYPRSSLASSSEPASMSSSTARACPLPAASISAVCLLPRQSPPPR